ncbi:MAG: NosD domain-containing protein [Limnochordia bacterium]
MAGSVYRQLLAAAQGLLHQANPALGGGGIFVAVFEMKYIRFALMLSVLLFLMGTNTGRTALIYVVPGNDSAIDHIDPASAVFESISEAVVAAEEGDVIILHPGQYDAGREQFPIVIDKSITITALENNGVTRIKGTPLGTVISITGSDVMIRGITVEHLGRGMIVTGDGFSLIDSIIELGSDEYRTGSCGIWLAGAREAKIFGNQFIKCGLCIAGDPINEKSANTTVLTGLFEVGEDLSYFNTHTVVRNTVNGGPLFFGVGLANLSLTENFGQIILVDCRDIEISAVSMAEASIALQVIHSNSVSIIDSEFRENGIFGVYLAYSTDCCLEGLSCVDNNHGFDLRAVYNTQIRGGKVLNCWQGVFFSDAVHNQIAGLEVKGNGRGICFFGSEENVIEGNIIADNNIGCYLQNAPANLIRENQILNNRQSGIRLYGESSGNGVEENLLAHNGTGVLVVDTSGIDLRGNIIKENNIAGVYLANSVRIKLFWNELIKNPIGLILQNSPDCMAVYNVFRGNEIQIQVDDEKQLSGFWTNNFLEREVSP